MPRSRVPLLAQSIERARWEIGLRAGIVQIKRFAAGMEIRTNGVFADLPGRLPGLKEWQSNMPDINTWLNESTKAIQ